MNQKPTTNKILILTIVALLGVVGYLVKEGKVSLLGVRTEKTSATIARVSPDLVHAGDGIVITGSNFSGGQNAVSLTPEDPSLLPAYDISSYKVASTDTGTEMVVIMVPANFEYGNCRSPGGVCQGRLNEIPGGVYYLSVWNGVCRGYDCESNRIPITVVNP